MNYLLFQPASITEPDRVYRNGKLLEQSSERSQEYDTIVALFRKGGQSSYPWIGKVRSFYLVRGLFDAKDEAGRTLSFLFASDNDVFKNELIDIADSINFSVDAQTYQAIDKFLSGREKKKKTWKYITFFLIVVFLITLIFAL